jgi:hypothetical protein
MHGLSRFTPPILQQLQGGDHGFLISSIYCHSIPWWNFPVSERTVDLRFDCSYDSKQASNPSYDL